MCLLLTIWNNLLVLFSSRILCQLVVLLVGISKKAFSLPRSYHDVYLLFWTKENTIDNKYNVSTVACESFHAHFYLLL
jgi:hypothetical protein